MENCSSPLPQSSGSFSLKWTMWLCGLVICANRTELSVMDCAVGVSLILSSIARSRVSPKLYLHNSALARSLPLKVNLFFALPQGLGLREAARNTHRGVRQMAAAKGGPSPRPGVLDIAPYVPGTSALPGAHAVIKLSSNETPLGPSPRAIEAYLAAADSLSRYPDGSARTLREAICKMYGLDPGHIVCGAGSDELLNLLAGAYLGPGDEAIYSEHGFLVYKIAIMARGATAVAAPETELTTDVDAILARVTDKTRVVFIANPNNPTGTYIPFDEVKRLRAGLP